METMALPNWKGGLCGAFGIMNANRVRLGGGVSRGAQPAPRPGAVDGDVPAWVRGVVLATLKDPLGVTRSIDGSPDRISPWNARVVFNEPWRRPPNRPLEWPLADSTIRLSEGLDGLWFKVADAFFS